MKPVEDAAAGLPVCVDRFVDFVNSEESLHLRDLKINLYVEGGQDKHQPYQLFCHRLLFAIHSDFMTDLLKAEDVDELIIDGGDSDPSETIRELEAALAFVYKGEICEGLEVGASLLGLKRRHFKSLKRPRDPDYDEEPRKYVKRDRYQELFEVEKEEASSNALVCCDLEFDNEVIYATHKEAVHLERPHADRYLICCDQKMMGSLVGHFKNDHGLSEDTAQPSKCCDDELDDLEDVTRHCEENHGLKLSRYRVLNCCAVRLSNLDEYERHKEEIEGHLECGRCTFISKDERHLNFHLFTKHKEKKDESEVVVETALSCKYCKQKFKQIQQRVDHEDKHEGEWKYECESCGKKFKQSSALKSHVYRLGKRHRLDLGEYSCDSCDRTFTTVAKKIEHRNSEHLKKSAVNCDTEGCERVFVDKGRLNVHKKAVHLKIKDAACRDCGKLFATQERARLHEKFVHVVETEAIPCDLCQKSFSNRERMIDHRRSVHRDRKYQCESCGSRFKNSSALRSHVVSIHAESKPLNCEICGKGFLHVSRLKAHGIIHSDAAPFQCRFCGRPNKCKNNNLKHEKRCKKNDASKESVS